MEGAYYKDIQYFLNPYVGTWRYVEGNTELVVTFKKIDRYLFDGYYTDALVGEMRYIKKGVLQFNNLGKITAAAPNLGKKHDIFGNFLQKPHMRPACADCPSNERRARLIFYGRSKNFNGGSMILQRIATQGAPDKMKLTIEYRESYPGEVIRPLIIQGREFVFTKM